MILDWAELHDIRLSSTMMHLLQWNLSLNTSLLLAHTARQTIRVNFWWSSRRAIWIKSLQGGLSRNKVAVRERAAGSPPLFFCWTAGWKLRFLSARTKSKLLHTTCAQTFTSLKLIECQFAEVEASVPNLLWKRSLTKKMVNGTASSHNFLLSRPLV